MYHRVCTSTDNLWQGKKLYDALDDDCEIHQSTGAELSMNRFEEERLEMIQLLRERGIRNQELLKAMQRVER